MTLDTYLPVLLFIGVGVAIGAAPMMLGALLGPSRPDPEKLSPYECGFEAFEDARMKFDVRYYLVAILFILFDLEIAFLFPWAIVLQDIGWFGLVAMFIFLNDDKPYLYWVSHHRQGYVLDGRRNPKRGRTTMHRAACARIHR